jgi:hypothetical protein
MNNIFSASKKTLIIISQIFWIIGGVMLLRRAVIMLQKLDLKTVILISIIATTIAIIKYLFVLRKTAIKNLNRILQLNGTLTIFHFHDIKMYIAIVVMIFVGIGLRSFHLVNIEILSTIYLGIGISLILSSFEYSKYLFSKSKKS